MSIVRTLESRKIGKTSEKPYDKFKHPLMVVICEQIRRAVHISLYDGRLLRCFGYLHYRIYALAPSNHNLSHILFIKKTAFFIFLHM